jgi:pyruvate/2-oxoglutarate dehydrogenase complex dihydrolipoamide dehydrogenase (E3) component
VRVDLARVQERRRAISAFMRNGNEKTLEASGADLIRGQARFVGPHRLAVTRPSGEITELEAAAIVIDVGARSAPPRLDGIETVTCHDSTSMMDVEGVPESLIILGGGYIGVEFAQMFARFGSRVTLVQRQPQLLPKEDDDVATAVAEVLRKDGVEVLLSTAAVRVEPGVRLTVRGPEGERQIPATHLMAAAGRVPQTFELGLDAAGIATDERGFIRVDERLRTSVDGVWAVGDANGGPQFTHVSYDDYRTVMSQLSGEGSKTARNRLVPYGVFIDPQLGRVGLSEKDAKARGVACRVASIAAAQVFRARAVSEMDGLIKVVVGEDDRILGAAVLAAEGSELMATIQTAMLGGLTWQALDDAIYAHPTFAEALNIVFSKLQPLPALSHS